MTRSACVRTRVRYETKARKMSVIQVMKFREVEGKRPKYLPDGRDLLLTYTVQEGSQMKY